jgi:thiol-disulfide isomerase/thioredoxin/outer membrane lipoprotein-sorting protein
MSRDSILAPKACASVALGGALALLVLSGCGSSQDGGQTQATPTNGKAADAPPRSARELLEKVAAAYRQAVTYSDHGVARVEYKLNDKEDKHAFPFSVTFAQPNRVWLKAYEGEVICDGKRICAVHESVRGYVRTAEAPEKLTPPKIYGDNFLGSAMNERQVGGPLQLEFLLSDKAVDNLLASVSGEPELIGPAAIGDEPCYRVRLAMEQGKTILWITQATGVLRRVEYPTEPFQKMLEQDGKVSDVVVVADFVDARLNEPLPDNTFHFEPPAGAKEVKQFVGPAPAEVLGKKLGAFEFTSLAADGGTDAKITEKTFEGKVVVLDFWATWCEYCQQKMPDIAKAYAKYKDNDKVRFLAVSIDQPEVTNDQVKAKLAALKVDVPAARDEKFHAFSTFKVPGIPSRILIGADGTVQAGAVGLTAQGVDPVAEVAGKIDALLAGKNLYAEMIAEFEKAMMQPPPEPTEPGDGPTQPEVKIAAKSEPQTVKLTPRWTCSDAMQPGNVLVVASADGPAKLLAIDNFHFVLEINPADGKVIARHDLKLPQDTAVAFLRTAVDGQGKRFFAASAIGQRQVFTFDEAWQPLGHYPPNSTQAQIGDVQLADLDGDGKLELCVGFLGETGVHAASLEGQQVWASAKPAEVVSLAVSPPDGDKHRRLFCVHQPGKITPLDHEGRPAAEMAIGQRAVRWLLSARLQGDSDAVAGFAYVTPEGENAQVTDALIGIDLAAGKDRWTYPLPTGQQPWLEQLAPGRVSGADRHWIAAAADGSLHFVAVDGKPLDHFNVGAAITGFAATEVQGKPHLVIAAGEKLRCWAVEPK